MPRWLGLTLFLVIVNTILIGIHLYLWWRLVRDPQLAPPLRSLSTMTLTILALSLPAVFVLGPILPHPWRQMIAWPAFMWMGAMFILLVVLVGADLARLAGLFTIKLLSPEFLTGASTKVLLARGVAATALGLGLILSALAFTNTRAPPLVREVEISLPGLAREMDGTTIALLTDLHLGAILGRDFARKVVETTNELEPDIIAITGDLVDYGVDELRDSVAPLAEFESRHGVFFVTGNHEYYAGVEGWLAMLPTLGMRVLRNEHVIIGEEGRGLVLAGVNDPAGAMHPGHAPNLAGALAGRDSDLPVVLLAHQPLMVTEAAKHGVALQLSGHTHHGQIWPFRYAVLLQQPYARGLVEHGPTKLYTSPGTGFWGPPMRLGSRSEITRIVLRSPDVEDRK